MAANAARAAALLLALLVSSAAAASLPKCMWAIGACNASPGAILGSLTTLKATTPQAEGMMRTFAVEASCHAATSENECKGLGFCKWTKSGCGANLEKLEDVIGEMPALTGCPGSFAETVALCRAAKTLSECKALPHNCGWLEPDEIPAVKAPTEDVPEVTKRYVRRKLLVATPMMRSNTSADFSEEELVMGPGNAPLHGCMPGQLAAMGRAGDVENVQALVEALDSHHPEVFGDCEKEADEAMRRCSEAPSKKECAKVAGCHWDESCFLGQAGVMAAVVGHGSPAEAVARECAALSTPTECGAAGAVEFNAKRFSALLPDAETLGMALAVPGQIDTRRLR